MPGRAKRGDVTVAMIDLNRCRLCRNPPRLDRFQLPGSGWVYVVECSSKDCDNAECGERPGRSRSALELF
jgi:hypothetical protein